MDQKFEEAVRAKENAERRFVEKDYKGAKSYALRAHMICPELEGIAQMVATFDVYIASEIKLNGESDFYSILGLEPFLERSKIKKQYRKMSALLHPDKNKTIGADGAFKLISEAWSLLSDNKKRISYNIRRNQLMQTANTHQRLDTFWTVCTSCQVQYEYLRKYLNKRLSCKNCRGVFVAVETGLAPITASYQYSSWSCDSNGYNSVSYAPTSNNIHFSGNGGTHSAHGSDYSSNVSFQWSSNSGSASSVVGFSGKLNQPRSSVSNGYSEPANLKVGKRRKVEMEGASGNADLASNSTRNNEIPSRKFSLDSFNVRKFLMGLALTEIHKKLEEMKPNGTHLLVSQSELKRMSQKN